MPPAAPPSDQSIEAPSGKPALRAHFRAIRRGIDAQARQRCDSLINSAIESWVRHKQFKRIAGYLAFDGEADMRPALTALDAASVSVFLPVVLSGNDAQGLLFRRWSAAKSSETAALLAPNTFGIEEPTDGPECPVAELDVVFLPGVAWDGGGGRLGMGAGYYDRALAPVAATEQPLRIGVAYDAQRADEIPMESTDIPLHGMVTESGLFTFAD